MAADAETNTNAWQNSSASLEHLRRGGVTTPAAAGLDDAEEFNSLVKYVSLEGRQIHLGTQEAPEHPQRAQDAIRMPIM